MKDCRHIFYTPEKQYPGMPHGEMCGDIMPFYWEGRYICIFLYKYCIYAVETKDFVEYSSCRLVLQNGTPDEQDWHAATGSVCYHEGLFYFYYTGFCEGNRGVEGKYEQAILRATSKDLLHWEKDTSFFFAPDERYYEKPHWRDPHVFWNDELDSYCMLITACEKNGAHMRNGCSAVYQSKDILNWKHYKTIYAPRTFVTHECHDCFQIGEWWYLTFSNYSRQWETRYRKSKSFEGPWELPESDDMLDGRHLYAAKTVSNGSERYLVGWQAIRKDCSDEGKLVWGGNIVVHELIQKSNGDLGVRMPTAIYKSFQTACCLETVKMQGQWENQPQISGNVQDGFGWVQLGKMEEECLIDTVLSWESGTRAVGVMFHVDGAMMAEWCQLRLEITHGKFILDRYNKIDGDQFFIEERPIQYQDNRARIQIIVSGNIIVAYVDDVALCSRCYDVSVGYAGVFVEYGTVRAEEFSILRR